MSKKLKRLTQLKAEMDNKMYENRLEKLAKAMKKKELKQVLIQEPKHIFYLTGYSILFPGVKNKVSLLINSKAKTTLFVNPPLAEDASQYTDEVITVNHSLVKGTTERDKLFSKMLERGLQKTELIIRPDIENMRRIKDKQEKKFLQALARLSGYGYQAIQKKCVPGATEIDLLLAAKEICVKKNKRDLFVSGDFVSGKRTLEIGGEATARKLCPKENMIVDLWLVKDHYWSDTCRTFFVGNNATVKQKSLLLMLKDIQLLVEKTIRPGVKAVDIYWQIQNDLKKYGYTCPHHLGHGIGLDFWEPPYITSDSTDVFEKDMVFTIEIGVYEKRYQGFRIEDNYIVTPAGIKKITGQLEKQQRKISR